MIMKRRVGGRERQSEAARERNKGHGNITAHGSFSHLPFECVRGGFKAFHRAFQEKMDLISADC